MNWLKKIFSKEFFLGIVRRVKKLFKKKPKVENRKVTKSRYLYWYIVFGSGLSLVYFIFSLFAESLPWHYALTPFVLLIGYVAYRMASKNRKLIWLYISDVEQGKLLLYMNKYMHFEEEHKMRLLNWVYLRPKTVRMHTQLEIRNRVMEGKDVSEEEKVLLRYKPIACPQQLRDGWNEAMLVETLIYAHTNIQVLDADLRDEMKLTDENILAFDLQEEYKKATDRKYQKMLEIGRKNDEQSEEEGK